MSGITLARPYAKAIFEYAHAQAQLNTWSIILCTLNQIITQEKVKQFLNNPLTTKEKKLELLLAPFANLGAAELQAIKNLLLLLDDNKRLLVLPEITLLFENLRSAQEKTLTVTVSSFSEFTDEQIRQLKNALSHRLLRKVTLNIIIDKSLLGGAIIRAGDTVIDGSIREQFHKLAVDLAI